MARPSKDRLKEIKAITNKARRDYIHGIFLNKELVYPTIESLVTRYNNKVSRTHLGLVSKNEKWREKRKTYQNQAQTQVVLPELEDATNIKEQASRILKLLLAECEQVERARIDSGISRKPKDLLDLVNFIKTALNVETMDEAKDSDIKIHVQQIINQFGEDYGKKLIVSEAAKKVINGTMMEDEPEDLLGQLKVLDDEEVKHEK